MSIEKVDFSKVTKEQIPYTLIYTKVIQNISDPIAGFIWIYLSSLPTGWKINKSHLKKHFDIGDDKLKKILAYLHRVNLIEYQRERRVNGTLGDVSIHVLCGDKFFNENQEHNICSTTGVKTTRVENHSCGNPPPIKEINNKKDIKKESKYFMGKKIKNRNNISEGFKINSFHKKIANELNLDVEEERKRFIDHYTATGKRMGNWKALFNNWLRKSSDFKQQSQSVKIVRESTMQKIANLCLE